MKRVIVFLSVLSIVFLAGCQQEIIISNITGLSAKSDGDDIVVSWDSSSDANCYYIYRSESDNENYYYWGVTEKTEIRDITVIEDKWYSYRVYPAISTEDGYVRGDKYMSSDSTLALTKPKKLAVEKTGSKCTIKWEKLNNASSYSVFRKEDGAEYELLGDTTDNYFIDNLNNDNKTYNYAVKMNKSTNEETYSSLPSVNVKVFKLPKITSVFREDLFTSVITWDSISSNKEESIEYSVYRSLSPEGEYHLVGTTYDTYFRDTRADKVDISALEVSQNITEYYYMIKINSTNQDNISYYSKSQIMKLDIPKSTSKIFVPRYVDFISKDESKILKDNAISVDEFENDLRYLKEEGYTTITSKELLDYLKYHKPLPEKSVMITIDEARSGVYKYAYPLLKEYNMKAVLGVVGEYADGANNTNDYCSWVEIKEMYSSGLFELASNSYYLNDTVLTSPDKRSGVTRLPYEATDQYMKALGDDVTIINDKLSSIIGKKPAIFVYPHGARNTESDQMLINEFGYELLLGDDNSRRTRMNYFIDNAPTDTQLLLINRRDRILGTKLSQYIIASQRFDEPDNMSDTVE